MSGGVGDPAGGSELSGRQVSSQPGQEFHHSARPRRLLHSTGTETSSQASHANEYYEFVVVVVVIIITPFPVGQRSTVMSMSVCLSVYPRAYLRISLAWWHSG